MIVTPRLNSTPDHIMSQTYSFPVDMSSVVRGIVSYSDSSPSSDGDGEQSAASEGDGEKSAASEGDGEGEGPPRKKQRRDEGDLRRSLQMPPDWSSKVEKSDDQRLPLPSDILEMFNEDESDDDGLKHEGRVRSFAHVRGNWATHVYIPFLLNHQLECCIQSFHKRLRSMLPDSSEFHTVPLEELHISLSRTVTIRHHCIEPLVEALRTRLRPRKRFSFGFHTLALYCNEEKTRSFIGLEVSQGYEQLLSLVQEVDNCFSQYRLETFYSDPSFHVSMFWCLGDILPKITDSQQTQLQEQWQQILSDHQLSGAGGYDVTEIRCKTGNKIFSFPLT